MCKPIKLKELLELRDISLKLREFSARLFDFESNHLFVKNMKISLDKCIAELNEVHHIIDADISKIKRENKL